MPLFPARCLSAAVNVMKRNKAIFIVGTTGVGKTKLSIQLAHRFNGEIINADAMQMYHGLNVATAKATEKEREGIPHHLLDFVDPRKEISIREFNKMAMDKISSCNTELPIVVGGTHYYIQSLIWDSLLDVPVSISENTLDSLDSLSTEELYKQLSEVDPAHPHHPHQRKRILSDLRLYKQTGVAPSALRQQQNEQRDKEERLDNVVVWLSCNDAVLDTRLNNRVDAMVRSGLLQENLHFIRTYAEGSDLDRGVWQAIGLKEFMPLCVDSEGHFNGRLELREDDPEVIEALDHVKKDTQQYAKRQITWIRNRLLGRVKHLIQVDTSQLDRWEDVVQRPVENVIQHLLDGSLPDVVVNHAFWEKQSVSRNKKFECSVCKKVIIGEEQWMQHLKGRVHKRHVASVKRREKAEKYFEEKKNGEGGLQ